MRARAARFTGGNLSPADKVRDRGRDREGWGARTGGSLPGGQCVAVAVTPVAVVVVAAVHGGNLSPADKVPPRSSGSSIVVVVVVVVV